MTPMVDIAMDGWPSPGTVAKMGLEVAEGALRDG